MAVTAIDSYVQGVNAFIAQATLNPTLLPADYAAAVGLPQPWTPTDVVAVGGLIGGIFGDGGGHEIGNAALLQYLQAQLGRTGGRQAFTDFKAQNDPSAPTTVVDRTFPYEIPGRINPALTAIPDHPGAPLVGGPTDTTPLCNLTAENQAALGIVASLLQMPAHMSNALVVGASHSADGHPIAVFGPQVSVFFPGDPHGGGPAFPRLLGRGRVLPGHRDRRIGPGSRLRLVGDLRRHGSHRPATRTDLQPDRGPGRPDGDVLRLRRQVRSRWSTRLSTKA